MSATFGNLNYLLLLQPDGALRSGELPGFDLWNWQGANGASLRRATEFLAPYADAEKEWPAEQIVPRSGGQRALPDAKRTYEISTRLRGAWPLN